MCYVQRETLSPISTMPYINDLSHTNLTKNILKHIVDVHDNLTQNKSLPSNKWWNYFHFNSGWHNLSHFRKCTTSQSRHIEAPNQTGSARKRILLQYAHAYQTMPIFHNRWWQWHPHCILLGIVVLSMVALKVVVDSFIICIPTVTCRLNSGVDSIPRSKRNNPTDDLKEPTVKFSSILVGWWFNQ